MKTHEVDLPAGPREALQHLAKTAEMWGAQWKPDGESGGHLEIPVMAGLRRGWVLGRVEVTEQTTGSRLVFFEEDSVYRVQMAAVFILLLAACGALTTLIAPIFPRLLGLVPMSMMLCIGAWFFVVARLRNSGPEEFFEELSGEQPEAAEG